MKRPPRNTHQDPVLTKHQISRRNNDQRYDHIKAPARLRPTIVRRLIVTRHLLSVVQTKVPLRHRWHLGKAQLLVPAHPFALWNDARRCIA